MDGSCSKTTVMGFRRGSLKMRPLANVYIYSIIKTIKTSKVRYGGARGFGGRGEGYNSVNQAGARGKISSPRGGNRGGEGGWGGSWGVNGHPGKRGAGGGGGGGRGFYAAPAIVGKSFFTSPTKIGNVLGAVT